MISRLSKHQTNQLHEIHRDWVLNVFTRKKFNTELIIRTLTDLYALYKLPLPRIIYAEGPLQCQQIATELRERAAETEREWNNISGMQQHFEIERHLKHSLENKFSPRVRHGIRSTIKSTQQMSSQIVEQLNKQHHRRIERFSPDGLRALEWCCYNDFLKRLSSCNIHSVAGTFLSGYKRYRDFVYNSGIFLSIYTESCAIVCPGPFSFRMNDKMELNNPDGPALEWDDGFRLHSLNGVTVSEVFFLPASKIDPVMILRESNAEARREIIRKIGIEKVIQALGGTVLDKWRSYELIALDVPGMRARPTYLKMLNPSVGVWHVEGVPPEIKTCREALAWRDGETSYIVPSELT